MVHPFSILESKLDKKNLVKLRELNNPSVTEIVEKFVGVCKPEKVTIIDDSEEDTEYVRYLAIKNGEEGALKTKGHTIHFDGFFDQGRDKENTKLLVPKGQLRGVDERLNPSDRDRCLEEMTALLLGIMKGKEMLVLFFCLGPVNSPFSILALQITDSAYVAHSDMLLYRQGYEEFKKLKGSSNFFYFAHSAGSLKKGISADIDKRRIYIDPLQNRVFSVNTQYAGNTLGLKKLALRLAIKKAVKEGWLAEHMFIMGAHPPGKERVTYFTGAFPSMCGKTSTAMLLGNTIVGDDIAYLRINEGGEVRAANIERGIFGIIQDVNPVDDPLIYKTLTTPGELIFSNVLIAEGNPYWLGMSDQVEMPKRGITWSSSFLGEWYKGQRDYEGRRIPFAHPNARYTVKLSDLGNVDETLEEPNGVFVQGIFYGGRDSDTSVPVCQCFDWNHGVFVGACIESETTEATIGKVGVRKPQPMANMDFIIIPLGKYLEGHFEFGKRIKKDKNPLIFATNYFLKDENGEYYDEIPDKKIWIIWAEGRVHGEYDAIKTPIGYIPKYEDLAKLFRKNFVKTYEKERYEAEFAIRVNKFLEKLDRIEAFFRKEKEIPEEFFTELEKQRNRLLEVKENYSDPISPLNFLE